MERRLTDLILEDNDEVKLTKEEMQEKVNGIDETFFSEYKAGRVETKEVIDEKTIKRPEFEYTDEYEQLRKKLEKKIKPLEKRLESGEVLDKKEKKEYKEAKEELKRIYSVKRKWEKYQKEIQKQEKKKEKKSVRFMKKTVTDPKIISSMNKLHRNAFYSVGMRYLWDRKRINDAYTVIDDLSKKLNNKSFWKTLVYLNPRDMKYYGKRVKDYLFLNHRANEILWEMNLNDKNNELVYGKGMYKSLDGTWKQEISDKDAELYTDKIANDVFNNFKNNG